ncbi:hypothetical protein F5984_16825 [Rudanella paleaurantiibacter]|uniref:Outer membrane beta-barrel protein n=1 Tax=Rudanella paleaurantiibacter TaxID=2614655 RepID=A0A7J5TXC4_9BACT|nr:hypothetical protein [Rudanella paleaurantiibacter]KAB7729294.1 hypothetical protein F5984_16825 [Rudanella paleaurantiibacter]
MKSIALSLFLFCPFIAFGQASVAYYPFNSFLSVSTNPNKPVWFDARVQTNTLFGSLSTTLAPMINVRQTTTANYYVGASARFNALNSLADTDVLEGYALHVGVRVVPLTILPNVRVAFELSPFARSNFKSGIFYSYLGVAYQFNKRVKNQ